tara:strand:+ start:115 stop:774 length:660 start_codon:yes stop_codon:yes gene_type:complete
MKKILAVIFSLSFCTALNAADWGMGISAGLHKIDAEGSEILRDSKKVSNANNSEDVVIPEIFLETIVSQNLSFGISYIPTRELGSKSRTENTAVVTGRDNGTYKAEAELKNVFKLYTDVPVGPSFMGGTNVYAHLGIQHVTVGTLEALNSGTQYPDKDIWGATYGIGVKGDLPLVANMYFKGEVTHTDFEKMEIGSQQGNIVKADLEDTAARLSIGYKF